MVEWTQIDTWIVATGALAAAACAIPGCYLFLRRQSMMADALAHSALPGVVLAFALSGWLEAGGWMTPGGGMGTRHLLMMAGALIAGLLTAWLTERIGRSGWIRADAALGVVFTSLFALGLLLLRLLADRADLDLDCVLYGQLELVAVGAGALPTETIVCAAMLAVNVGLVWLLSKELLITTFDPQQAAALGFHPRRMHYGLMVVTTTTLVAAFEVVGSILVIGMLVVPAAAASFVTARLSTMLAIAVAVALASAVLGHVAAITLPGPLTRAAGLPEVLDVKTSGAMILVSVAFLIAAMLFGPHRGYWSARARP